MEKSVLKSKAFWLGLISAILPLFPVVSAWVAANPSAFGGIIGALIIAIRFVTKDRVVIG